MTKIFNPHDYQKDAIDFILDKEQAGLFVPVGLGKTACSLSAIKKLKHQNKIDRVLIIAPLRVCYLVWPKEIEKWENFNGLTISIAHGKNREKALNSNSDIVVINPDGLQFLARTIGSKKFTFKGKRWMLIVDESSNFKNSSSARFKLLKRMTYNFERKIILTATPAPNGLLQLWSQVFVLDDGERLGKSFSAYRSRYFYQSDYMGYIYAPYDWAEDKIYEKINDLIMHKSSDELDLPERIDNFIPVDIGDKARVFYEKMKKDMMIQLGDKLVTAVNAAVVAGKLKQIANGGIYDEDGNTLDIHDEKTKAVKEIVESLAGRPLLVFYEYNHDLSRLKKAFPSARVLGNKAEDLDSLVNDWNNSLIPILLIQVASGSHGLNLQGSDCHDVVWYSLPYDRELYVQACGRVHRQGVKNSVTIHHIVGQKTIDERIVDVLKNKEKVETDLLMALLK